MFRLLSAAAATVFCACLVLSRSRGVFVAYAAMAALTAFFSGMKLRWSRRAYAVVLPALAVVGLGLVAALTVLARRTWDPANPRLEHWSSILSRVRERPFGLGIGAAGGVSKQLPGRYIVGDNQYMKVLAEVGFLGLLAYLVALFLQMRFLLIATGPGVEPKLRARVWLAFCGSMGILVACLTANTMEHYPAGMLFWLINGMAVGEYEAWEVKRRMTSQTAGERTTTRKASAGHVPRV